MTRLQLPRLRGFSLLEIIVALGVLAVGASAAFALLVAAAAAGKRAEHHTNAALIAESVLGDMQGRLVEGVDRELEEFEFASEQKPAANPATRYLRRGVVPPAYPDYRYDLAITPLPGADPSTPWHYLVEVEVRWSQKGKRSSHVFSSVMLKTLSHLDNPTPP